MPDEIKFVGNCSAVWGTNGVYTESVIVDSGSVKNVADKTVITDNNGNTKAVVLFNERKECSITVLAKSDATIPDIGNLITIGGVANCVVEDATENWTKGNAKSITITATFYKYLEVSNG